MKQNTGRSKALGVVVGITSRAPNNFSSPPPPVHFAYLLWGVTEELEGLILGAPVGRDPHLAGYSEHFTGHHTLASLPPRSPFTAPSPFTALRSHSLSRFPLHPATSGAHDVYTLKPEHELLLSVPALFYGQVTAATLPPALFRFAESM